MRARRSSAARRSRPALPIRNVNRVVGTILGSEVTRRYGAEGLPDDTIQLSFQGSAGQSFGAFLPPGITLTLEGDANDYVGKGLSGGRIVVFPPRGSTFVPEQNIIVGNVALYGATAGEAFFCGVAGERFCVRNSGASVGGRGRGRPRLRVHDRRPRGRARARPGATSPPGMTGGIAYVLDEDRDFATRCNKEMVQLHRCDDAEEAEARQGPGLPPRPGDGQRRAPRRSWSTGTTSCRASCGSCRTTTSACSTRSAACARRGLSPEEAAMAAFELNVQDSARAGGK